MTCWRPSCVPLTIALLAGLASTGLGAAAMEAPADLIVPGLDGGLVSPLAPAGDTEATVLLFVMSDCPISNRYAPEVRRIHESFGERTAFWLVYVDTHRPVAELAAHRSSFSYPFAAVRDVEGVLRRRRAPP